MGRKVEIAMVFDDRASAEYKSSSKAIQNENKKIVKSSKDLQAQTKKRDKEFRDALKAQEIAATSAVGKIVLADNKLTAAEKKVIAVKKRVANEYKAAARKQAASQKAAARAIVAENKRIVRSEKSAALAKEKSSRRFRDAITSQKVAVLALGSILTGVAAKSLIDTQKILDKINNTLKVAKGTTAAATKEFEFLEEESERLGLGIEKTALSYARFSASAMGSILTTKQQREIFLGVAEASAAMGLEAEDTKGALIALQQMMSKGVVSSEELRQQFAERIPGALELAAKAMGMTKGELSKQLELGKVMAVDLLPKLAREMRKTFGAQAVEGPNTLNGRINILNNSMFDLKRAFLEAGGAEVLKSAYKAVTVTVKGLNRALGSLRITLEEIEGKDFITDEKQNRRLKDALTTIRELRFDVEKIKDLQGQTSSFGLPTVSTLSSGQKKILDDYQKAVDIAKEIQGRAFDPSRVTKAFLDGLDIEINAIKEKEKAEADAAKRKRDEERRAAKWKAGEAARNKAAKLREQEAKANLRFIESEDAKFKAALEIRKDFERESLSATDRELSELQDSLNDKNDILRQQGIQEIDVVKTVLARKKELEKQASDEKKQKADEDAEERKAFRISVASTTLSGAGQVTSALSDLASVQANNQIRAAERAARAEIILGVEQGKSKEELASITAKNESKINAIRKESFEEQKRYSLASAGISTAQAATNALATVPFLPLGPIMLGTALLAGGIQIAAIQAQKYATGGFVTSGNPSGDTTPALVNKNEAILNPAQQRNFMAIANGASQRGGSSVNFNGNIIINSSTGDPQEIASAVDNTLQKRMHDFADFQKKGRAVLAFS